MAQVRGVSQQHEIRASIRRKDTRTLWARLSAYLRSKDGVQLGLIVICLAGVVTIKIPFSGELLLLVLWVYRRLIIDVHRAMFDFPYRVPKLAGVLDGSQDQSQGPKLGNGLAYLGNDLEHGGEQIYAGDSDLRTHMLVLGTTGSGKPQPVHANVLTPTGWRTMGSLKVGDVVCTPDGKTATIQRVIEQGVRLIFTVRTKNGRWAQATGDHLWRVLVRRGEEESTVTVTTDGIAAELAQGHRVLLPEVKRVKSRRGIGAKFKGWAAIERVEKAGKSECRCIEIDHPEHLYITDNHLVTHNTEFLLGLVFNALVQNTGCIYVDGKGDPKLQKEIFRLARYLGREDDLLIINFITSGRDFVDKQVDKVTNNMNMMGNTSSGMLIELIVALMDDSGGGGDMWKGRAISFVAALTRPLTYLRDKGFINLSPEKYLEYFELNVLEELVFEHNGKYGDMFDLIVAPLRTYLLTLPGYSKAKLKKQDTKTLEQHGFIVMQLTRIFNDLTFNYGHIFKTRVGDVDFFDVVINRRILVVLLPALERAPDSMRMLGKMVVGSIKQLMAGCLGNRVEGVVREIIDSRPTNSPVPFYTILDEYGYYAVIGFAVAPAQARSLGFSVIFAAQDFSSLKKSSAEEADATWENTNVRATGRLTSGLESETWKRISGAAGEASIAQLSGYERHVGVVNDGYASQDNIGIERRNRLEYDDLAQQADGEFTFLIGKKEQGGRTGGVRVIRGKGFFTGGSPKVAPAPKDMRINDLIPIEAPEPSDMPQSRAAAEALLESYKSGAFPTAVKSAIKSDPVLTGLHQLFERNHLDPDRPRLSRPDAALAALGWYLSRQPGDPAPAGGRRRGGTVRPAVPDPASIAASAPEMPTPEQQAALEATAAAAIASAPTTPSAYSTAEAVTDLSDADILITASAVTTNLVMTGEDRDAFMKKALPILQQHLFRLDEPDAGAEEWAQELEVANRNKLLDMEILAAGEGFASLGEKWAAEEAISRTRVTIANETSYTDPPVPEPVTLETATEQLNSMAALAKGLIKKTFSDEDSGERA